MELIYWQQWGFGLKDWDTFELESWQSLLCSRRTFDVIVACFTWNGGNGLTEAVGLEELKANTLYAGKCYLSHFQQNSTKEMTPDKNCSGHKQRRKETPFSQRNLSLPVVYGEAKCFCSSASKQL